MLIKHQPHKNADYAAILAYYTEKHTEDPSTGHYEPILDAHGIRQPRENCRTFYINAQGEDDDPEHFVRDCILTNLKYRRNQDWQDVKNHEYILSHPAEDRPLLTDAMLEQEARAWAKKYGKGYQVLISIHRDTDNDHIHITVNSVRDGERAPEPWMQKGKDGKVLPCETKAGGKHQQSIPLRYDMNDWALAYTKEHGLVVEDNNQKARETTAARYSNRNRYLRNALIACRQRTKDAEMLEWLLRMNYRVDLIIRENTISLKHPDAKKATRLRSLGLTPEDLDLNLTRVSAKKPIGDHQVETMWFRFKAEDDAFWNQVAGISNTLKEEKSTCGLEMRERKAELRAIREQEKLLENSSIFERRAVKNKLESLGNPTLKQERIATLSDHYNEYNIRLRNLEEVAGLYKLYSYRAYQSMQQGDWEGFHCAMESMRLVRERLPDRLGVFEKQNWTSIEEELEFMRGVPDEWERKQSAETPERNNYAEYLNIISPGR